MQIYAGQAMNAMNEEEVLFDDVYELYEVIGKWVLLSCTGTLLMQSNTVPINKEVAISFLYQKWWKA